MKLNISAIIAVALFVCNSTKASLTDSQKKELLSLHKKAREAVHAPDMKSISWDDKLARASQEYSEECRGLDHSHTGPENISVATVNDVKYMFNGWMEEKDLFDESGYRSSLEDIYYKGKDIGHYSQVVWAATTKVGCGLSYCENNRFKYTLICRYDTGNYLKKQVYALGSSSSNSSSNEQKSSSSKDDSHKENKTTGRTTTVKKTTTTTTTRTTTVGSNSSDKSHTATSKEEHKPTVTPGVNNNNETNTSSTDSNVANTDNIGADGSNAQNINENVDGNVDGNVNGNVDGNVDGNGVENNDNENVAYSENINEEDGVIREREVGKSTYQDETGKYVVGIAVTGTVVGAAAAFVFLKKNPKQYEQLTKSMKNIQRGFTKKANSVKHGATVLSRKMSRKNFTDKMSSLPTSTNDMEKLNNNENYTYTFNDQYDNYDNDYFNSEPVDNYAKMYK